MSVLARAPLELLEQQWAALASRPERRFLRAPEVGLAMVRGRISASGGIFNLGEISVTRCTLSLPNGNTGFACVKGRSKRHAELAATFDALLQDSSANQSLMETVIAPLHRHWQGQRAARSAEVAKTKVDFFTMARGE